MTMDKAEQQRTFLCHISGFLIYGTQTIFILTNDINATLQGIYLIMGTR